MSEAGTNYLNHDKSLKSWLTTVDHKRIGIMYLVAVVVFLRIFQAHLPPRVILLAKPNGKR